MKDACQSFHLHSQVDLYLRRINRVPSESRREAEVRTRQSILQELYGEVVEYGYAPDGSPCLLNAPCLNISLSHSDQWFVLGVSTQQKIGVDIEDLGSQIVRVATRFCKESELLLAEKLGVGTNLFLHLLWSAKESAYKLSSTKPPSLHAFRLEHIAQQEDCCLRLRLIECATQKTCSVFAYYTPQFVLTLALNEGEGID